MSTPTYRNRISGIGSVTLVLIVGLTGGIGAGKSTAARRFASLGATVVDIDALGHVVLQPGGKAHDAVLDAFGTVDRRELGPIVFADQAQLDRLTAISHPAINAELVEVLDALLPAPDVVVLDMAVLVGSNLGMVDPAHSYSVVVTVEAPIELRVERAVARGMAEADVLRRLAAQASEVERRALAAHVIVNDGDQMHLHQQVHDVWAALSI